ncbi:hypothetical protein lbkm_0340 [Lachnospiraceae bacterium KM106-2]|nr:hypothetical protein lbkm_0340 [Lachnospiraceae bacterium KM106-2]
MNLSILAGPILGAAIGYCTNYIAVKMMFRPLKPVYIGKHKLPYTPGIIPKGKGRLAKAIGSAVGTNLLTTESLVEHLSSNDIRESLKDQIHQTVIDLENNDTSLKELTIEFISESQYETSLSTMKETITDKITNKVTEMNVGDIIAKQVVEAISDKVKGTLLAMMVNDSLLNSILDPIASAVNTYIEEHGQEMIEPGVSSECDAFMAQSVGDITKKVTATSISINDIVLKIYDSFVSTKLESILNKLDIAAIVEKKIDDMDVLELEALVLSVMKKELNAIVNLGALIGFILGLINLLF